MVTATCMDNEEAILLKILGYTESEIRIAAFKRLTKIYKTKIESHKIYSFLESISEFNVEQLNKILEYLFEFVVHDNIYNHRVSAIKSNNKIMESFLRFLDTPSLQSNLLLILYVILCCNNLEDSSFNINNRIEIETFKTENDKVVFSNPISYSSDADFNLKNWLDPMINVFCNSESQYLENLSYKIIMKLLYLGDLPSNNSLRHLKSKLNSEQIEILQDIITVRNYSVDDYIKDLESHNFSRIETHINEHYFIRNSNLSKAKVLSLVEILTKIINQTKNTDILIIILSNLHLIIHSNEKYFIQIANDKLLQPLLELLEEENEDIKYHSMQICKYIVRAK